METNTQDPPQDAKTLTLNQQQAADLIFNALTARRDWIKTMLDPRRDIDEECGYATVIEDRQYRLMYDRELGRRVVGIYPEECWKLPPVIAEDPDPDTETEFEKALEDLDKRHQLLHYMHRVDEMSGVGQYGVLLWGLSDGAQLHEPVKGHEQWAETTGKPYTNEGPSSKLDVIFVRVLDASLVRIATYVTDVTNPRYGKPETYTLTLDDPTQQESGAAASMPNAAETTVHWTRITHIADNCKTSEVLGVPRMQPVWNRLYDLRKVLGGSGEMFWKGGFPGISLETHPSIEDAEFDADATRDMMAAYQNGLQRYIALEGMAAKSLAPQIADPTNSFEVAIKAICVTIGVPYRVFMGVEEGVVSGDQATKAWDSRLRKRQEDYVTPRVINPVLQRLVDYGALPPTAEPMGWTVTWPDLSTPSELDKAEVGGKRTQALAAYVSGNVDTLVPPLEYFTVVLGMEKDEAEALVEAAVEHIGEIEDEDTITPGRLPVPEELEDVPPPGGTPPGAPPKPGEPNKPPKPEEGVE